MHCEYFDTTRNANHSNFLTPTMVGGRYPFPLKFALRVTHSPSKNAESRPPAFQRAIDGVRTLPISALKGSSKSDFFVSWVKVNGWSSFCFGFQLCVPHSPPRVLSTPYNRFAVDASATFWSQWCLSGRTNTIVHSWWQSVVSVIPRYSVFRGSG